MDILFVLLGLAIFYAAAAVFAIEHYEINPAQAAVSFVIPPFAWWLYYHHWQRSQKIAYTQIVAFFLLLGGIVLLTWFSGTENKKINTKAKGVTKEFDSSGYVGSDASLKDLTQAERISSNLNGRIRGETFVFNEKEDVAEFDSLGTLRIKHGSEFFGDFEIAIEFNELPPQTKTPWVKTFRVNDTNAPTIYISWYDNDEKTLRSRKYKGDYNLDLKLMHEEYNLFSGKIQLVLPDPEQSFIVGNIPVFNSRLRFHGEGINKEYDSVETLEAIAAQRFNINYKKYVTKVLGFEGTDFDYRSGDGIGRSTIYTLDDENKIRVIPLLFYKNNTGWYLDVKDIKDQLKAENSLRAVAPTGLRQAIVVDVKNIGNIQAAENLVAKQEPIKQDAVATAESTPTTLNVPQAQLVENPKVAVSITQTNTQASLQEKKPAPSAAPQTVQSAALRIDVVAREAEMAELLQTLMNKDVELATQEGKFKNGVYVGIHRKQVVLEVAVGGGTVEFLTEFHKMKSLRVLNSPSTAPQMVEFFSPSNP